jgi:hypothetical protein
MNLFRSEEHARNFTSFDADWAHTLLPVARWAEIFSSQVFRQRGRPDYVSWLRSEAGQAATLALRASMPTAQPS